MRAHKVRLIPKCMGLLNVVAQLHVKDVKLFKERSLMLASRSCSKSCVIATSIVEGELGERC
jgi:hypothetical protein